MFGAVPVLFLMLTASAGAESAPTPGPVIDTKTEGVWSSVPFEFLEGQKLDMPAAEQGRKRGDWVRPPMTLQELCAGVKITKDSSGNVLLEWRNHHRYPTIATRAVPADWSSSGSLALTVYSAKATGEVITVGVRTGNPATPNFDYWTLDVTVNWSGWKKISLPFAEFDPLGEPTDWTHVKGLYFFSKDKKHCPSPATVLYFYDVRLLPKDAGNGGDVIRRPAVSQEMVHYNPENWGGYNAPVVLNHDQPELLSNLEPGRPLTEQFYHQGARAVHGYNPRYTPGYVSIDPAGNAYIRTVTSLEYLDAAGHWQEKDLMAPVRDYCRKNNKDGFGSSPVEPEVRFDKEGGLYVLMQIEVTKGGKGGERMSLLLYAKGITEPWTSYKMPKPISGFELMGAYNQDALNHPPVITLRDFSYFKRADQNGYLLLPEKQADGTLHIPEPIPIGRPGLETLVIGPVHSGQSTFVISQGEKIYVVYGSMPLMDPKGPDMSGRPSNPQWLESLHIPAGHPAKKLSYKGMGHNPDALRPATDGVPTFVREYDRSTRKFSDPVFIGYGGAGMDDHNWSATTMDSHGNLHVVMTGHIEPITYTHTLNPGDITAWSDPVYLPRGPGPAGNSNQVRVSYPAFICDKADNLMLVCRDDTGTYNHRIGMVSKDAGKKDWNADQSIVVPFNDGYHVWHHKVTYDPVHNRHYLTFEERCAMFEMTRDASLFFRFIWPFWVPGWNDKTLPSLPEDDGHAHACTASAGETTVMVSDDNGKHWRLATTPDFINKPAFP